MTLLVRLVGALVGLSLLAATASAIGVLATAPRPMPSSWRPVGEIVLLSVAWLLANSPYEGRVLWTPLRDHGLTVADLAVVPPLAVALLLAVLRSLR